MSILQDIYDYIKTGETDTENFGLEIEHFVLDKDGNQIGFDEITSLIERIGQEISAEIIYVDGFPVGYVNEKYSVSLEPSCQFEISINPYSSLAVIESVYREFLELWEPIFRERGYSVVTSGNLPSVEQGKVHPDEITLTPKKRYQYMDAYFRQSGKYGKYMMRASASTQVSVDYSSESDLVRKLRVLQKISPILMLMMENKTDAGSTLPDVPDKPHLFRIQEWDDLDPDRTGFFPHSLEADFGYEQIANVVYHTPLILLTDNGTTSYVGNKNAEDLLNEGVIVEEELDQTRRKNLTEHFLSMGFFHFRIKKYIEIRVADSVPINKALGYVALLKGIVYSDQNLDLLEEELSDIDTIDKIQDAVIKIEKDGHDAIIYHNITAAQWAARLVQISSEAIPEQERKYLAYV
jgi:glutamate--cysteine ligase